MVCLLYELSPWAWGMVRKFRLWTECVMPQFIISLTEFLLLQVFVSVIKFTHNFLFALSTKYTRICRNISRFEYRCVCYRSPALSQFLYLWWCDCFTLAKTLFLFSFKTWKHLQWNPSLINLWKNIFSYTWLKSSLNGDYEELCE